MQVYHHHTPVAQTKQSVMHYMHPNSCIHALLPSPRDPDLVRRLRHACTNIPALTIQLKKYHSSLSMDFYTANRMLSILLYYIVYALLF